MASIIDAFQEPLQDNNAIIKYIIYAIPVYFSVFLYNKGDYASFWTLATVTYLVLFGFMVECSTNVRNGKDHILPSFNILALFWNGIKGTIALGPSIAINCWLASFVCGFIPTYIPEQYTAMAFQFIIWMLFGSIILTGYLCYAKNFKISEAYNFKMISDSCVDIMVAVLFMIPQVILANIVLIVPVTYVIWIFVGLPSPIATFYWSVVLVFNLAMCGHYLAQVDYEAIRRKDNKDKII